MGRTVASRPAVKLLRCRSDGHLTVRVGAPLLECARLRVKDVDFEQNQLIVRAGKGDRDRVTVLPPAAREPLRRLMVRIALLHRQDIGIAWCYLGGLRY